MKAYTLNREYNLSSPCASSIDVRDIALSLSRIPRFLGHTLYHAPGYSVAQHSVIVSHHVPAEFAAHGLLHDAEEAYVGDIVTPVMCALSSSAAGEILELKVRWRRVVFEKFGLKWCPPSGLPAEVLHIDHLLLMTELSGWVQDAEDHELCTGATLDLSPHETEIMPADMAEAQFLRRGKELKLW